MCNTLKSKSLLILTLSLLLSLTLINFKTAQAANNVSQTHRKTTTSYPSTPPRNQPLDRIVAIVNNDIITQSELNETMRFLKTQMLASHIPIPKLTTFRQKVLDSLVQDHLQTLLAEKNNIQVKPAIVDQVIHDMAKNNRMTIKQFKHSVESLGIDFAYYRSNIQKQLRIQKLQQRLIGPKVHVTQADIHSAIQNYQRAMASQHAQYHLIDWHIALPDNPSSKQVQTAKIKAQQLVQLILSGQKTSAITTRLNHNKTPLSKKDLGWQTLSDLPDIFVRPVQQSSTGNVIGPIRADNGFHVIKLIGQRSKMPPISTQEARQIAYRQVFLKELQNWLKTLKASAYIQYLPE